MKALCAALLSLVAGALLAAASGRSQAQEMVAEFGAANAARSLVLRSTTDIAVFGPVVEAFLARRSDVAVLYEQWGSNDLYRLTKEECQAGRPAADVVISSGVHQMVRLVNEACADTYASRLTDTLPAPLRWRDQLWGITREPAVVVYNRALVPASDVPKTRFDLLDLLRPSNTPYAGRVATYDIERSGLGYLFAFSDAQEASTFGALQESFGRTGAVSTCCSADIIRGVADGRFLIAYNVLGSYAQGFQEQDDRIGIVLPADYTLVLSRALMFPKGAANLDVGFAFLDYLLSQEGRKALRDALLISPMLEDAEGLADGAPSASTLRPIGLSPSLLVALDAMTRDTFLRRWRANFPAP